jgi:hypothetical protein
MFLIIPLNQVEGFIGLLTERRIRRGTFASVRDLEAVIPIICLITTANPGL